MSDFGNPGVEQSRDQVPAPDELLLIIDGNVQSEELSEEAIEAFNALPVTARDFKLAGQDLGTSQERGMFYHAYYAVKNLRAAATNYRKLRETDKETEWVNGMPLLQELLLKDDTFSFGVMSAMVQARYLNGIDGLGPKSTAYGIILQSIVRRKRELDELKQDAKPKDL